MDHNQSKYYSDRRHDDRKYYRYDNNRHDNSRYESNRNRPYDNQRYNRSNNYNSNYDKNYSRDKNYSSKYDNYSYTEHSKYSNENSNKSDISSHSKSSIDYDKYGNVKLDLTDDNSVIAWINDIDLVLKNNTIRNNMEIFDEAKKLEKDTAYMNDRYTLKLQHFNYLIDKSLQTCGIKNEIKPLTLFKPDNENIENAMEIVEDANEGTSIYEATAAPTDQHSIANITTTINDMNANDISLSSSNSSFNFRPPPNFPAPIPPNNSADVPLLSPYPPLPIDPVIPPPPPSFPSIIPLPPSFPATVPPPISSEISAPLCPPKTTNSKPTAELLRLHNKPLDYELEEGEEF